MSEGFKSSSKLLVSIPWVKCQSAASRWNLHLGVSGLLHLQKEEETHGEDFPQFQGDVLQSDQSLLTRLFSHQNIKLKPENFTDFLIHEVRIALSAKSFLGSGLPKTIYCRSVSQGLKCLRSQHIQPKASKGHCR